MGKRGNYVQKWKGAIMKKGFKLFPDRQESEYYLAHFLSIVPEDSKNPLPTNSDLLVHNQGVNEVEKNKER